jgi:hypothetical protein
MVLNGYDVDSEPLAQKLFTVFDTADAAVAEVAKLLKQYLAASNSLLDNPHVMRSSQTIVST